MISDGCGYDLSFGYEYKLFESLNPVCQTAEKKLVRFIVVRVEYDSSNRVCIRRTGSMPSHAVTQGAIFLPGGRPSASPHWRRRCPERNSNGYYHDPNSTANGDFGHFLSSEQHAEWLHLTDGNE